MVSVDMEAAGKNSLKTHYTFLLWGEGARWAHSHIASGTLGLEDEFISGKEGLYPCKSFLRISHLPHRKGFVPDVCIMPC